MLKKLTIKSIIVIFLISISSVSLAKKDFSGTWETVWGSNNKVKMSLIQKGNVVSGYYPYNDGHIQGTVSKHGMLRGTWKEVDAKVSGTFQFKIDKNGKNFQGKYRRGKSGKWKSRWNGKLSSKKITINKLYKRYHQEKMWAIMAINEGLRKGNHAMSLGGGFKKN